MYFCLKFFLQLKLKSKNISIDICYTYYKHNIDIYITFFFFANGQHILFLHTFECGVYRDNNFQNFIFD